MDLLVQCGTITTDQLAEIIKHNADRVCMRFCIFTSPMEVMFSPGFVCGFVSLFVCEQDNSKTCGRILMKSSRYV